MGRKKIWIGELRYRVETAMRNDLKMSDKAIKHLSPGFKLIEKYLIESEDGYYTTEAVKKLIDEKIEAYHQGNFAHCKLSKLRRADIYLKQYYNNGKIEYFQLPILGRANLNNFFEDVVAQYVETEHRRGVISSHVIYSRKHKTVRMPFSKQQIEKPLQTPDRNTPMGKRDAAMMLLAARTGLRGIDIVNLKFSEINWHSNEITIVQRKTGKSLSFPLFADVGNAISEYILNGRPKSDSEYIFLSTKAPYDKMWYRRICDSQGNGLRRKQICSSYF